MRALCARLAAASFTPIPFFLDLTLEELMEWEKAIAAAQLGGKSKA